MKNSLQQYKQEVAAELHNILQYWMDRTIDEVNGGFLGKIDHDEIVHRGAPKGSVLNSRILWSFSAAYKLTGKEAYRTVTERAFNYLLQHFFDKDFGGVYWTVDASGKPLDTKKQIYALAFAIYGASEYFLTSNDERAKALAQQLYYDIVKYSYDVKHGGYIEALSQNWQELDDLRLSAKDANERKSMNTHLHVLEGFANLYRIWPDEDLKERIDELVTLFLDQIVGDDNHLILFFSDNWEPRSNVISYGHDIEAAWLIQEAAELIGNENLLAKVKEKSVAIARAASEGLDRDGGLWYEYDKTTNHLVRQKHWWPQAEAMVGFLHVGQISGEETFLQQSLQSWAFIKDHILDKKNGEWVWGVNDDYSVMAEEDKVGLWKCPYHNSRACIEVIRRISALPGSMAAGAEQAVNR
ncbi:MAG TPA: AGE family epimerase/isomerase [Flavisolibacter sp.]|jgi:mannobiose 2-epimerase|nr:AGE family epimerase/isomerase [Flavisolibacter sp.]